MVRLDLGERHLLDDAGADLDLGRAAATAAHACAQRQRQRGRGIIAAIRCMGVLRRKVEATLRRVGVRAPRAQSYQRSARDRARSSRRAQITARDGCRSASSAGSRRVGRDRAVAKQAIGDDERSVRGRDIGAVAFAAMRAASSSATSTVVGDFTVDGRRHERLAAATGRARRSFRAGGRRAARDRCARHRPARPRERAPRRCRLPRRLP